MENSIQNFEKQFDFQPEIINGEKLLQVFDQFVICGMGGSHLAAGILQKTLNNKQIFIHRDYGLSEKYLLNSKINTLFIASSYSGNTEEVLDFTKEVYSRGLNLVILTKGGKLLEFAKENSITHIVLPESNMQPRMAIIHSLISMTKIIEPTFLHDIYKIKDNFNTDYLSKIENQAIDIFPQITNKIPVIYSSSNNRHIAYNWKIKFNETSKIPAFYNSFPELNHNEMQGFDFNENNSNLMNNFCFIFLKDESDDNRILKRFQVLEKLYQEKGYTVISHNMLGYSVLLKILNTIMLADFISLKLAEYYKNEPDLVPFIENFKKLMLE
jgi:glucose/mannose-6-phosphate isomerase